MTVAELPALTIAELQPLLRAGEVSPVELLDALQARIAAAIAHAYEQSTEWHKQRPKL